jgi:hypothetical protein
MDSQFWEFFHIFGILQYILYSSEVLLNYNDIVTDIQGYKFKFFHDEKGNFTFLRAGITLIGYVVITIFLYRYVILTKMKYFEAFLFISMLYVMWDVCYVISFNNVIDKLPIIAYDIFVVGGFGLVSTLYIINQYKNLNLVILSILHILSILFFFYIQHRDEST